MRLMPSILIMTLYNLCFNIQGSDIVKGLNYLPNKGSNLYNLPSTLLRNLTIGLGATIEYINFW